MEDTDRCFNTIVIIRLRYHAYYNIDGGIIHKAALEGAGQRCAGLSSGSQLDNELVCNDEIARILGRTDPMLEILVVISKQYQVKSSIRRCSLARSNYSLVSRIINTNHLRNHEVCVVSRRPVISTNLSEYLF